MIWAYAVWGLVWTIWVMGNLILAITKPKHENLYVAGMALGLIALLGGFLWALASKTPPPA